MRGRQFLMKDMYSFSTDAETSQQTYAQIRQIYDRIFGEILQLDEDVIKVKISFKKSRKIDF